jgi:hypothetical protein
VGGGSTGDPSTDGSVGGLGAVALAERRASLAGEGPGRCCGRAAASAKDAERYGDDDTHSDVKKSPVTSRGRHRLA